MTYNILITGLIIVAQILAVVVPVLISVAFLVYAERKVLALIQLRRGPNIVGPFGILQSFADALKLITKENIIPSGSNKIVFILAPIITMVLSLAGWAVIPFAPGWVVSDINVGIMYLFAVSSLGVYGVIMAGWASNSQYPFLGALRSAAQMVSYEVSIGFVIITVLLCVGSLNLSKIVLAQQTVWFAIPLLPMFIIFFISALAETNRLPFDLPEDESTLVAGFFTEYSSSSFVLFFLGEYASMILMSSMTVILFLGGWLPPFDIFPFNAIPGVILAVAFITFFSNLSDLINEITNVGNIKRLFIGSFFSLILAYFVRFFSLSFNGIKSSYEKINNSIDESAYLLGYSKTKTFSSIHIPYLKNNIILIVVLISLEIIKELPITLILRPFNFETFATQAYVYATQDLIEAAALPSLFLIGWSAIFIIFSSKYILSMKN